MAMTHTRGGNSAGKDALELNDVPMIAERFSLSSFRCS